MEVRAESPPPPHPTPSWPTTVPPRSSSQAAIASTGARRSWCGCWGRSKLVVAGTSVELASRLERAILATLALRAGRSVAMDTIARSVWGETPPSTWRNSLHVRMSHLRRRLDEAGARGDLIRTAPDGYALALTPDEVDAERFEQLVSEGRRLLAAGDAGTASATLQEAFDLWRGEPLPEIAGTPSGAGEVTRLLELRELAFEEHHDAALALGQHQAVIGLIEAGLVDQPLRERRWAQLILALYRGWPPGRCAPRLPARPGPTGRRVGHRAGIRTGESGSGGDRRVAQSRPAERPGRGEPGADELGSCLLRRRRPFRG